MNIPEVALGSHRQILENEPEASLTVRIVEPAGVDGIHPNKVSCVVLVRRWGWYRHCHGSWTLSVAVLGSVL